MPEDFSIYKIHLFNRVHTNYPVDTFYHLHENNIPILLELENKKGYKVFPRISEYSSVYHIYDYFLEEIAGFVSINLYAKLVNSILSSRLEHYYQKILRVQLGIEENDPSYQIPNNLTLEEYDDMIQPRWIPSSGKAQIEKLYKFQEEYKIIRNRIDFEIIYPNAFVNKYFREFYCSEGWREEILSQVGPEHEFSAPDEASSKPAEFKNDGDGKEVKQENFSAPYPEDSDASDISQQSELKCEEDEKPENGPTSISDDSDAPKAEIPTDKRIDENSHPSSPEIETESVQQEKNGSSPIEQKKVDKASSLKTESAAVQDVEIESVPEDQKSNDNNITSSPQSRSGDESSAKSESIHAHEENGNDSDGALIDESKIDYDTEQESSKIVSDAIQVAERDSKDDIRQKNQTTISKSTFEDSDSSSEEIKGEIEKSFFNDVEKNFHIKTDSYFAKLGDTWFVKFQGKPITLRDLKRLRYIIHLLDHPNEKIDNRLLVNELKMPEGIGDERKLKESTETSSKMESIYEDNAIEEILPSIIEKFAWLLDEQKSSTDKNKIREIDEEIEKTKKDVKDVYGIKVYISDDEVHFGTNFPTEELKKNIKNASSNIATHFKNFYKDIEKKFPELEVYLRKHIQKTEHYAIFSPGDPESSEFIKWEIIW